MPLIGMRNVSWGFDDPPLLEDISFKIESGERVCLLGRNGAGKSTLFKLLRGEIEPDEGEVWRQKGATVSILRQEVSAAPGDTLFDVVAGGAGEQGQWIAELNRLSRLKPTSKLPDWEDRQEVVQRKLDAVGGWEAHTRVDSLLSRIPMDPDQGFSELSAGMKRRVLFLRAVAAEPDLLLLDEPTNHLDIDTIDWLEEFVLRQVKTLLFITHDRAFLKRIANRIIELDRGRLVSYRCDYDTYLNRRTDLLNAEDQQTALFNKRLSREEEWIRKGIKARRTRNEGRVRKLLKMREAHQARRQKKGKVNLRIQEAEKTGKLVVEAKSVHLKKSGVPIIENFSALVMRGDRIGIVGPNGIGKTTLLNLLLKQVKPDSGSVRHGTHLHIASFDQLRTLLDEEKTVRENIGGGNDFITFNGRRRHVLGYLRGFLFSPERCRSPVSVLSGGEKNRLLLAKLFIQPANVLVMDEPTNDLDTETLELLEEVLFEFNGTLLLVSHDRTFLNNVVTGLLVFEENGRIVSYAGGYDDWQNQRSLPEADIGAEKRSEKRNKKKPRNKKSRVLGYMEKRELKALPGKIENLEAEQQALFARMSDPAFYSESKVEITRVKGRFDRIASTIESAYARWEELEAVGNGDSG